MGLIRKPFPLDRVRELGLLVFGQPFSANLVAVRGPGGPGDWDGLLYLLWATEVAGWVARVWPCATRPGPGFLRSPINPSGTAMIAPGQHRLSHEPGLHRGRPALVQVGEVRVLRDPDRDNEHEPTVPEVNRGGGFNIHDVRHPNELAGCIGLLPEHRDELLKAFGSLVPYQGRRVSLTVLEIGGPINEDGGAAHGATPRTA